MTLLPLPGFSHSTRPDRRFHEARNLYPVGITGTNCRIRADCSGISLYASSNLAPGMPICPPRHHDPA